MDSPYRSKWIQDPIQVFSSPIGCSNRSDSIYSRYYEKSSQTSKETGSGKDTESGNSWF